MSENKNNKVLPILITILIVPLSAAVLINISNSVSSKKNSNTINGDVSATVNNSSDNSSISNPSEDVSSASEEPTDSYIRTGIYGVSGLDQSSMSLTRTDNAVDLVANVQTLSTPVVENSFDNIMPWAGMKEINDEYDNQLIYVPGHYEYKSDSEWKVSMESQTDEGWFYCPSFAIGKYQTSGSASTPKSNFTGTFLVSQKLDALRTSYSTLDYEDYFYTNFDVRSMSVIQTLMTIEFASTNSAGLFYDTSYKNNTVATEYGAEDLENAGVTNGYNDTLNKVRSAFYYRGIQNLWGNGLTKTDGVKVVNNVVYTCDNPMNYANSSSYTALSISPVFNTRVSKMLYQSGSYYVNFPSDNYSGSATTYYGGYLANGSNMDADTDYYLTYGYATAAMGKEYQGIFSCTFLQGDNTSSNYYSRMIRYSKTDFGG